MTEMTELEIARQTQECLYWMVHSGRVFSGHDPVKMHAYWRARVAELQAAQKEAETIDEPKHDLVLDRLAALEARFDRHEQRAWCAHHERPADL